MKMVKIIRNIMEMFKTKEDILFNCYLIVIFFNFTLVNFKKLLYYFYVFILYIQYL